MLCVLWHGTTSAPQLPITVFIHGLHDEPDSYVNQRLLDRGWLSPLVSSTGEVACRNMVRYPYNPYPYALSLTSLIQPSP